MRRIPAKAGIAWYEFVLLAPAPAGRPVLAALPLLPAAPMSVRSLDGPAGVRALATVAPCPPHRLRVLCPPPTVDHGAALAREGFTPAEIAGVGALVECTDCHALAWVADPRLLRRVFDADR